MRKWRTLIRIVAIDEMSGNVFVLIPGWDYEFPVPVKRDSIPFENLHEGQRLHAQANIGAENMGDLDISDWEEA